MDLFDLKDGFKKNPGPLLKKFIRPLGDLELFDVRPASIEDRIVTILTKELINFEPEWSPKAILSSGDHYKAMSAMQKAIRLSDPLAAGKAATALSTAGKANDVWRRLAVISYEDVGLGDLYGLLAVVTLATSTKLRKDLGERACMLWSIERLASATKSRDLCDVVVYAFLKDVLEKEFQELKNEGVENLVTQACSESSTVGSRVVALWLLLASRFNPWSEPTPDAASSAKSFYFEKAELPVGIEHAVRLGFKIGEALHAPIPAVWSLMCGSSTMEAGLDPFDKGQEMPKIGPIYAATYDKHTRLGKAAARIFMSSCHPVMAFAEKHIADKPLPALERAIFYVEGALLRPRLKFDTADSLFDSVLAAKMADNGLPSFEVGKEFYALVQTHLPSLNAIRAKLLSQ